MLQLLITGNYSFVSFETRLKTNKKRYGFIIKFDIFEYDQHIYFGGKPEKYQQNMRASYTLGYFAHPIPLLWDVVKHPENSPSNTNGYDKNHYQRHDG